MDRPHQYWMVHGVGQRPPVVMHASEAEAEREAERLARANAGIAFVVMKAVTWVRKSDVSKVRFKDRPAVCEDLNDDDIPF